MKIYIRQVPKEKSGSFRLESGARSVEFGDLNEARNQKFPLVQCFTTCVWDLNCCSNSTNCG